MTKVTNAQLKTLMETQASTTNSNFQKAKQAISGKVDKVTGKGLSTKDFTAAHETKLDALPTNAELQSGYVAKDGSKVLSDENFTSALKTKLEGVATGAQVNVVETVKINGTALTPDANKAVNVSIPAAVSYTIAEAASTSSGMLKTYVLKADGVEVSGSKIDIPKDYLLKSATVGTCTTANSPLSGLAVGNPYLDLVFNTKDNSTSTGDTHQYVNLSGLVDVYTGGTGINVSNNAISIDTTVVAQKSDLPDSLSDLTDDLMAGYSKAASVTAVGTSDSVKVAIGKLEKALDGKQASGSYAASSHNHTKSQITDFPTAVSAFTNDAGYLTSHQSLAGKQDKIDSSHKLSADLLSEGTTVKLLTAAERTAIGTIGDKVEAQDVTDTINTIFGSISITAWDDITLS